MIYRNGPKGPCAQNPKVLLRRPAKVAFPGVIRPGSEVIHMNNIQKLLFEQTKAMTLGYRPQAKRFQTFDLITSPLRLV